MESYRTELPPTFSVSLALCVGNSPVTGEFSSQRPVTRSFHVFFDLCLNKRLSKQSWGWWFETPLCSLWRHCNATRLLRIFLLLVLTPGITTSQITVFCTARLPWYVHNFVAFISLHFGLRQEGVMDFYCEWNFVRKIVSRMKYAWRWFI